MPKKLVLMVTAIIALPAFTFPNQFIVPGKITGDACESFAGVN